VAVKAVAVVGDAPMWAPPNRPETSSLLILFKKRKVHKLYDCLMILIITFLNYDLTNLLGGKKKAKREEEQSDR
jgi:hypothetical protein